MKILKSLKEHRRYLTKWFKKNRTRIFLILFFYPSIVCFTPDSTGTSNTFFDFMIGLGKYATATYDCEGNLADVDKYPYFDYGASVSHNIDEFKFGLRAGGFSINNLSENSDNPDPEYENAVNSAQYINPFVGYDHKYIEVNFGVVLLTNGPWGKNLDKYFINNGTTQLSGFLRIGNEEAFHFSAQYLSSVPIFSGSMVDAGFGFGSKESRNLTWAGISAGPFQNAGIGVKQHLQLSDNFDLLLKGRIGQIESHFEGSISAGVRYNFF